MTTPQTLNELAARMIVPINKRHRYLVKRNADGEYVGSTDDLGIPLPLGHVHADTIGKDGLGTRDGRRGISDFLKARANTPGDVK